jgi:hypothetical protein
MLLEPGLYYPYIHFRDETWLKLAALYWPSIHRIVPNNYPVDDSETAFVLSDGLDFIHNLLPGKAADMTAGLFLELLDEHGDSLPKVLKEVRLSQRETALPPNLSSIYAEKMASRLITALVDRDLAIENQDWGWQRKIDGSWITVDSRLAEVYMCVLAANISQANHLTPVTDSAIAQAAVAGGWTVERIASALLGADVEVPKQGSARAQNSRSEKVAYLALELAIPRGIEAIPAAKIVNFRRHHVAEITAFQTAVAQIVIELDDLSDEMDETVLNQYINEAVSKHLTRPKNDLKAALKASKWETSRGLLTASKPLPAVGALVAGGIAVDPVVGVATGLAMGITTLLFDDRAARKTLRKDNAAANYLLEVESHFSPVRAVLRQSSLMPR